MLPNLSSFYDRALWNPFLENAQRDFSPSCEVAENEDHYLLTFDVPGVKSEDLNIELTGTRLVVAGERKSYGKFQKVFTLPEGTAPDGISADLKDGVLQLTVQKPSAARTTKITIASTAM